MQLYSADSFAFLSKENDEVSVIPRAILAQHLQQMILLEKVGQIGCRSDSERKLDRYELVAYSRSCSHEKWCSYNKLAWTKEGKKRRTIIAGRYLSWSGLLKHRLPPPNCLLRCFFFFQVSLLLFLCVKVDLDSPRVPHCKWLGVGVSAVSLLE